MLFISFLMNCCASSPQLIVAANKDGRLESAVTKMEADLGDDSGTSPPPAWSSAPPPPLPAPAMESKGESKSFDHPPPIHGRASLPPASSTPSPRRSILMERPRVRKPLEIEDEIEGDGDGLEVHRQVLYDPHLHSPHQGTFSPV